MAAANAESLICGICDKSFTLKKNLYRHMREVHAVKPKVQLNRSILCPVDECSATFSLQSQVRSHLTNEHKINLELEVLQFKSFEDFRLWKEKTEQQTKSSYTLHRGTSCLTSGYKVTYYQCHRSTRLYKKIENSSKIRHEKSTGPRKTEKFCPSCMEVYVNENEIVVNFYKRHFGHDLNIKHLSLSEIEKMEIAVKLKAGIPFWKILDDIRNSVEENDEISRIHLTNRQDLYNITAKYNITNDYKLHENDALSVDMWVEVMSKNGEESPVIFYKKQGEEVIPFHKEDFLLVIMTKFQEKMLKKFGQEKICIDSTHGTNAYDFQLTTILTIDEFSAGVPTAFCLSNRIDETAMVAFFENVARKTGKIKATVFMSDDFPAYYNAWKRVMEPATHTLLCTWHVDNNWRKNLNKIKGNEKKTMVYKYLRILIKETDKTKFEEMIRKMINLWKEDEETKEFSDYFEKNYSRRPEKWASCYRGHLGINTNMHLESFHKTLKYHYLDGKQVKRVDKTISILMKYARDSIFSRITKLVKQVPSGKIKKIRESHIKSSNVSKIVQIRTNAWKAQTDETAEIYDIIKNDNAVCENKCQLRCDECNICIHQYNCSCSDNFINFNICKHIHACAKLTSNSRITVSESNEAEISEISSFASTSKTVLSEFNVEKKKDIIAKWSIIKTMLDESEFNSEDCSEINKKMDNIMSICSKNKRQNFNEKSKVNVNANVTKQMRFVSSRKRKVNPENKISMQDKKIIINALLSNENEAELISKDCNFDHQYYC